MFNYQVHEDIKREFTQNEPFLLGRLSFSLNKSIKKRFRGNKMGKDSYYIHNPSCKNEVKMKETVSNIT